MENKRDVNNDKIYLWYALISHLNQHLCTFYTSMLSIVYSQSVLQSFPLAKKIRWWIKTGSQLLWEYQRNHTQSRMKHRRWISEGAIIIPTHRQRQLSQVNKAPRNLSTQKWIIRRKDYSESASTFYSFAVVSTIFRVYTKLFLNDWLQRANEDHDLCPKKCETKRLRVYCSVNIFISQRLRDI